jgi:hypothetical protein
VRPGPDIRRFYIDGATKDPEHFLKKQAFEEDRLKARMLREQCVPVLDITPVVTFEYNPDKETFLWVITMYGVEVEDDACLYEGWLNGTLLPITSGTKWRQLSRRLA